MNTRTAGYLAGFLAAALLLVLITVAIVDDGALTRRFAVGCVVEIILALAASKLISVDRAEQRGRERGQAEGFEEGYDQGWVVGAAHRTPRDNVTQINGAASPRKVHQRSG